MIWSLQTLRFVAALMVVYIHAAQSALVATRSTGLFPYQFQTFGHAGVDIFFVISGVIIARTAPGLTWRQFAWRRFRRIIPLYLGMTLLYLPVGLRSDFGWRDALATILLWPATDRMTAPVMPVAWTLCFEVLFYAAATLVLINRNLIWVILVAFAAATAFPQTGPVAQFLGNPLVLEFAFGVALVHAPSWRPAVWLIPIGAAALVAAGFIGIAPGGKVLPILAGDGGYQRVLVYGIPAALIVFGTMQIRAMPSIWTILGDASYTLYLIHLVPIFVLRGIWLAYPISPDFIILIGMGVCVLLAWRVHVRFEVPLLRFLDRRAASASTLSTRSA